MSNERYTRNRNMWKKNYSTVRHKPRILEIVTNSITKSVNLETYQRHRSYYVLYPDFGGVESFPIPPTSSLYIEWDDGKAYADGTEDQTYTVNFVGQFENPPIVTFKVFREGSGVTAGTEDLFLSEVDGYDSWTSPIPLVYGVGVPTTESAQFKFSFPYSGSVHYFATAESSANSFPLTVTQSSYFSTRSVQVAGGISSSNGTTSQTLIWEPLTEASTGSQVTVYQTPFFVSGSEYEATRATGLTSSRDNPVELSSYGGGNTTQTTTIAFATGTFYYHYIAVRVIPI